MTASALKETRSSPGRRTGRRSAATGWTTIPATVCTATRAATAEESRISYASTTGVMTASAVLSTLQNSAEIQKTQNTFRTVAGSPRHA